MKALYNINQLSQEIHKDRITIKKILTGIKPDGTTESGYNGYYMDTFNSAYTTYINNKVKVKKVNKRAETRSYLLNCELKQRKIDALTLSTMKQKGMLCYLRDVNDYILYFCQTLEMVLKEYLQNDNETYNKIVDKIQLDLNQYKNPSGSSMEFQTLAELDNNKLQEKI